jgi:HSP20 family protein
MEGLSMFKLTPFENSLRKRDDEFVNFYNLIDDFFSTSPLRSMRQTNFRLDVKEEDNKYLIEAELPGVKKEDIKLSYDDNVLTISIEHNEEKEDKKENYIHRERHMCSMKRALNLPGIDPAKMKARLEDGVLKVVADKQEIKDQSYVIEVE